MENHNGISNGEYLYSLVCFQPPHKLKKTTFLSVSTLSSGWSKFRLIFSFRLIQNGISLDFSHKCYLVGEFRRNSHCREIKYRTLLGISSIYTIQIKPLFMSLHLEYTPFQIPIGIWCRATISPHQHEREIVHIAAIRPLYLFNMAKLFRLNSNSFPKKIYIVHSVCMSG